MKKRLLASLLCIAMVIVMLPVTALAEETDWTEVSSADGLTAALETGGNIRLTEDITITDTRYDWTITQPTVLDLNGCAISSSYGAQNHFILVINGGSLTITDNSTEKSGKIEATDSSYGYGIQLRGTGSSFTLLAGTIQTTQETVDIHDSTSGCSINISGGKLISTGDNVLGVRGSNTTVDITGGEMESAGRTGVYVSNYGDSDSIIFNMTGGTLTHTGGMSGAIQAYRGATITIGGDAQLTSNSYVIQAQNNIDLSVTGGTLTSGSSAISASDQSTVNISGGTITSTSTSTTAGAVKAEDNASVTITNGTLSGRNSIRAEDNSTVDISGGQFTSTAASTSNISSADEAIVTVLGGTFDRTVIDEYLQEGNVQDPDSGEIVIDTEHAVASIGTAGYTSLQAAVDGAKPGDTIQLLKTIELDAPVFLSSGDEVVIQGGEDIAITFPVSAAGGSAFEIPGGAEDVSLTVNQVAFVPTSEDNLVDGKPITGFGIVVRESTDKVSVQVDGCTFENLWCGVYFGHVEPGSTGSVSITNSIYTNTNYGYSIDEVTTGAAAGAVDHNFAENTDTTGDMSESEAWTGVVYATAGGATEVFSTIQDAVNYAESGSTIIVTPGSYDGNITFGGKSLTIQAQYPAYQNGVAEDDPARLSTFTGTFNTYGADASDFQADQTIVIDGFALSGNGLKIGNNNYNSVGTLEVRHCTMTCGENLGSASDNFHAGLNYFVKTNGNNDANYAEVTVEDNYISGTPADGVFPLQLWDVSSATVRNNVFDLTTDGACEAIGVSKLSEDATVEVSGNQVTGGSISVTTWKVGGVDDGTFAGTVTVEENAVSGVDLDVFDPIFVGYKEGFGDMGGTVADSGNTYEGEATAAVIGIREDSEVQMITVTFQDGNTILSQNTYTLTDGEVSIELPEPSKDGYRFRGWSDGETTYQAEETVILTADTVFAATWTATNSSSGSSTYSVRVASGVRNGTVTVSTPNAYRGETVTITVTPDSGYRLDQLAVTDGSGNELLLTNAGDGRYTFTMPASRVEIQASFVTGTGGTETGFTDVPSSAFYAAAVDWAVEQGITNGTSATTFSPNITCTRGEMVTFLWRAAGSPAAENTSNPFADVQPGAFYYEAVLWAAEQGITLGTSETTFSPNLTVTRGQTVTFLYRAAGSPAVSGVGSFTDVDPAAYYATAVQWAVEEGVTLGTGEATFSPDAACSRGEIVTFLYRDRAE